MKERATLTFRLEPDLKADFQRKVQDLGFRSISSCLHNIVEVVTYDGSLTPREQALARHLSKIRQTITLEETEKVYSDFCEFMDAHNYIAATARSSMDEFMEIMDVFDTDSLFAKQFFYMFNYALIPHEIPDLLKAYYRDSHVNQKRREKMTNIVRANLEDTDISSLMTPAQKKKIENITIPPTT